MSMIEYWKLWRWIATRPRLRRLIVPMLGNGRIHFYALTEPTYVNGRYRRLVGLFNPSTGDGDEAYNRRHRMVAKMLADALVAKGRHDVSY